VLADARPQVLLTRQPLPDGVPGHGTTVVDLDADREIEVLSKTGLDETRIPHSMLTPVDQLFGELTNRQLTALQIALENGYYEQPRKRSISELAEGSTVARATFEEHLRKAENKLIKNAGQFIHLLNESRADDGLRKEIEPPIGGRV
jgi:predicted DNA-binding protein YlxM (UPF0122 family)